MADTPMFNPIDMQGNRLKGLPAPVDNSDAARKVDVTAGGLGVTGVTGVTGATGVTGVTGSAGTDGVTGATGPAGTDGVTGATGPAGSLGVTGVTGATGSAGSLGVTGVTGANGPIGPNGVTGATGPAGSQGVTGVTGVTGSAGGAGVTGVTGVTGTTGATGPGGSDTPATLSQLGTVVLADTEQTEQGTILDGTNKPLAVNPTNLLLRRTGVNALLARPASPLPLSSSSSSSSGGYDFPTETQIPGDARGTYALDIQARIQYADQVASGTYAVAMGGQSEASGYSSVAVGTGFGPGFANRGNRSKGGGSSTFGVNNQAGGAGGNYSSAFGYGNTANSATGYDFAAGNGNNATGGKSITVGRYGKAYDTGAFTFGSFCYAYENYCGSVGYVNTTSTGERNLAFGNWNYVTAKRGDSDSGRNAAFGISNKIYGYCTNSSAIGVDNYINGLESPTSWGCVAVGRRNKIYGGDYCLAFGAENTINYNGDRMIAVGFKNRSYNPWSAAFGVGNYIKTYGSTARHGVAVGSYNTVEYSGVAFGRQNECKGGYNSAVGRGNDAFANDSCAIGNYNYTGDGYTKSVAMGMYNDSYTWGVAMGYYCKTNNGSSRNVATGFACYAGRGQGGVYTSDYNFADGLWSQANATNSVAVGYYCYTAYSNTGHAVSSVAMGTIVNRTGTINDTTGAIISTGVRIDNGINSQSFGSQIKNYGLNAVIVARIGYVSTAGTNASGLGKNVSITAAGGSVLGGVSNTVSGAYGTVVGGDNNTASGLAAIAMGRRTTAAKDGELAHNSLAFQDGAGGTYTAERGYHRMTGNAKTTDATETLLMSIPITAGSAVHMRLMVIGNEDGGVHRRGFTREITAYRDGSDSVVVGACEVPTMETCGSSSSSSGGDEQNWQLEVSENGNNLEVRVTGEAATSINWGAVAQWVGVGEDVN